MLCSKKVRRAVPALAFRNGAAADTGRATDRRPCGAFQGSPAISHLFSSTRQHRPIEKHLRRSESPIIPSHRYVDVCNRL
jgi:hypothetical protein